MSGKYTKATLFREATTLEDRRRHLVQLLHILDGDEHREFWSGGCSMACTFDQSKQAVEEYERLVRQEHNGV